MAHRQSRRVGTLYLVTQSVGVLGHGANKSPVLFTVEMLRVSSRKKPELFAIGLKVDYG